MPKEMSKKLLKVAWLAEFYIPVLMVISLKAESLGIGLIHKRIVNQQKKKKNINQYNMKNMMVF